MQNTLNFLEPKEKQDYLFIADLTNATLSIGGLDIHATKFTLDKVKNDFNVSPPKPTCYYTVLCKEPCKDLIEYINQKYNDKTPFALHIVCKEKNINYSFKNCKVENYFQPKEICGQEYELSFTVIS